jgi:hypothetical protein
VRRRSSQPARRALEERLGHADHVVTTRAQGRHVELDDGQAVEEIRAEVPRAMVSASARWVAETTRTSIASGVSAAERLDLAVLEDAQQLGLARWR